MKNPKECFCLKQNQTFFVLNELVPVACEDGSEPLMFHHETFSRFKFVIINAEKKAATANIPVIEFPGIFEEIRNRNLMKKTYTAIQGIGNVLKPEKEQAGKTAAYTVTITAGRLKGKTPAGALLENAKVNETLLLNQEAWLKAHLKDYPKNQVQIQAIQEAISLYHNGTLKNTTPISSISDTDSCIYKTGCRPLIRRKRADGKCFVYEIKISWQELMDKPVEIEIRNYYAPVSKDEKGLLNVHAKERSDEIKNTFSLSMSEWFWLEHQINTQMRTFENLYAAKMYTTANDAERANRALALGS